MARAKKVHPALVLAVGAGLLLLASRKRSSGGDGNGDGQGSEPIGEVLNPRATLSAATIYSGQQVLANFLWTYRGPAQALTLEVDANGARVAEAQAHMPESPTMVDYSQAVPVGLSISGSYPVTVRIVGSNGWVFYQDTLGELVVYGVTLSNFVAGMGHSVQPTSEVSDYYIWYPCQVSFDYVGPGIDLVATITTLGSGCIHDESLRLAASSVPRRVRWLLNGLTYFTCGAHSGTTYDVQIAIRNAATGALYWQGIAGRATGRF